MIWMRIILEIALLNCDSVRLSSKINALRGVFVPLGGDAAAALPEVSD
jgi:hypothetical protein